MTKVFGQERWCENNVSTSLKPIRLIQLVLDVLILLMAISLWGNLVDGIRTAGSVILSILFASFVIIIGIDAIGQIGGCRTPSLPMLPIAFLGLILFTSAAQVIYLFVYQTSENWRASVLVLIALCLVAALLFLLDAMISMTYWRYACTKTGKCLRFVPSGPAIPPQPMEYSDASTSVVWDNNQLSSKSYILENGGNNRRQYVDGSTHPNSKPVTIVETQTQKIEPAKLVDHETSAVAVVKEKKAQTISPCPVCASALDYSPEGICPSFLALVQNFGMFSCAGSPQIKPESAILVDKGTLPGSNASLDSKESTLVITKKAPRVYETRPCPTHGAGLIARRAGLPNPITRISVTHSVRKNKRSQTPASRPIVITDKYQNTEINIALGSTTTQCSSTCQSNEKHDISIQENPEPAIKIEESQMIETIKEESSPKLQGSFRERKSSEKLETLETRKSGMGTEMDESSTKTRRRSMDQESLSPKVRSSFEKKYRTD